jgi:hypothetical protein
MRRVARRQGGSGGGGSAAAEAAAARQQRQRSGSMAVAQRQCSGGGSLAAARRQRGGYGSRVAAARWQQAARCCFFVLTYVPALSLKPQRHKDFLRRREGQTTHYGLCKILRCAAPKATLLGCKTCKYQAKKVSQNAFCAYPTCNNNRKNTLPKVRCFLPTYQVNRM